jgi:hypothetical protein
MPITVTWADPQKTAYHWRFVGRWTWPEYNRALDQANAFAEEVSYPIDVIVDLRSSGMLPSNILSNIKLKRATQPEKLGRIALLGANLFVKRLMETIGKLDTHFENKFFTVTTYEEAVERLSSYRNTQSANTGT